VKKLSPKELITADKFILTHILFRKRLHQRFKERDIYPGQPAILHIINEFGVCSQKDICDKIMTSPASVAVSIRRMQNMGLIEKLTDEKDMRFNKIRLTEKGVEAHNYCRNELKALSDEMLDGFSENEKNEFDRMLVKMIENLSKEEQ